MWKDEAGNYYNETELRRKLYTLGMQHPAVVMEFRTLIDYAGYIFIKVSDEELAWAE